MGGRFNFLTYVKKGMEHPLVNALLSNFRPPNPRTLLESDPTQIAFQHLFEEFRSHVELTEEEFAELEPSLSLEVLKKKEFLVQPGQISTHMNFIHKGCLRVFYLDQQAQEHTLQVGVEGWWVSDFSSFIRWVPSELYTQALEETVLVRIPKKELEALYLKIPAFSHFFREKIQGGYVALQERTIHSMSQDAYSRYLDFIKKYRNIEQRIPQYVVASYLGVTPEFLSHLRKKHAKDLS